MADSTTEAAAPAPAEEIALDADSSSPSADPSDGADGPTAEEDAAPTEAATANTTTAVAEKRWPSWPGDSVFRLIVPVSKVGSIIGRKGELIKKMCEDSRARIRILEGPLGSSDRIVLVYGKEEPDAKMSPAMDAALRVFKRVTGLTDGEGDGTSSVASLPCSFRMLIASSQAISLIGKQGTLIKSIQENSGAHMRVLSAEETPSYATSDERVLDIQGETMQVYKALEASVGHLRKFLVDRSVIPLFEKNYNAPTTHDHLVDTWADKTQGVQHATAQLGAGADYALSLKRDSLYLDRESQLDSQVSLSGLSAYGQDPALGGLRSSTLGRTAAAMVTQVTQTMQIPLYYAEDIIGVAGANIAYIRSTSGAILTVQESRGMSDEITVEIKGSASQVQTAQTLIQDFMAGHKEPRVGSFSKLDSGLRSYSQYGNSSYPSSSLSSQSLGGYRSSGVGYSSYRL
ncbi:RNA-binding KH domain-containing protein PEPPER [Nymphaea thermarum]|nr:RNA-binding KH domain-containing protein PEPPER [Nymphaea thermarum]